MLPAGCALRSDYSCLCLSRPRCQFPPSGGIIISSSLACLQCVAPLHPCRVFCRLPLPSLPASILYVVSRSARCPWLNCASCPSVSSICIALFWHLKFLLPASLCFCIRNVISPRAEPPPSMLRLCCCYFVHATIAASCLLSNSPSS